MREKKKNYRAETYIISNAIIYDTCYLIVSMILTNVDVIIQKCIGSATMKNAKTF